MGNPTPPRCPPGVVVTTADCRAAICRLPQRGWRAGADHPQRLLPVRTTRCAPYIYSQSDLDRLLDGCSSFFRTVRVAATMRTLIGLLAATGLRIGEATRLRITDLDADQNVLTVHGTKRPLDRLVPIHPSTTAALLATSTCPSASPPARRQTGRSSSTPLAPASSSRRSSNTSAPWSTPCS